MRKNELKFILFRYIPTNDYQKFVDYMCKNGQNIGFAIRKPDSSLSYKTWDYPNYQTESLDVNELEKIMELDPISAKFSLVHAYGVFINPTTDHYEINYILAFTFELIENDPISNKEELREIIIDFTEKAKKFTNKVVKNEKYRPIIWFLPNRQDDSFSVGILGVKNKIKSFTGNTAYIERGFPIVSYLYYGDLPESQYLADMALASSVVYIIEREYRGDLLELSDKIDRIIMKNTPHEKAELPKTIVELNKSLETSYRITLELNPLIREHYKIRKNLIRIAGLIDRVKEKCGSLDKNLNNLMDVICSDAFFSIDQEAQVIINDVEARLKWIDENGEFLFNQLSEKHNRSIGKLGQFLQSTVIVLILLQISDMIINQSNTPDANIWVPIIFSFVSLSLGILVFIFIKNYFKY